MIQCILDITYHLSTAIINYVFPFHCPIKGRDFDGVLRHSDEIHPRIVGCFMLRRIIAIIQAYRYTFHQGYTATIHAR